MKISQSTFTISSNGFADGPAEALRDYLLAKKAQKVTVISHPLVKEGSNKHIVTTYERGKITSHKEYKLPHRPPYTFILDHFVPLRLPASTAWFGFNNLASLRGLRRKRRDKAQKVYYWAVDFVPNRFGDNLLTKIYNKLDKTASCKTDGRIELTQTAVELRSKYLKLNVEELAPAIVVPMGAWLSRTPKADLSAWSKKR